MHDIESLLESNDVSCAGCYDKMGYRGAPIAQLSMGESDDCRGWLVGEANRGLSYMFQMMNEARINVGLDATAISSAAYHAALEYTRERLQGMDLLGRKVTMHKGRALTIYLEEVGNAITTARDTAELRPCAENLNTTIDMFNQVTTALVGVAMKGELDRFLADATLYLEFSGIICIAWQWLLQGMAARSAIGSADGQVRDFLEGKLFAMKFFFEYELPKIEGLRTRLMSDEPVTVAVNPRHFTD